jgi:hypothetical protein
MKASRLAILLGIAIFGTVGIDPVVASETPPLQAPVTGTGGPGESFGRTFDTDGATLIVHAHAEGPAAHGILHFFRKTGESWVPGDRLIPSLAWSGLPSISVRGQVAVLGYPDLDACLIFEQIKGVWKETALIQAATPVANSAEFGAAVIVSDHGVLVGAPSHPGITGPAVAGGGVHAYVKSGKSWKPQGSILPASLSGKRFGTALASDGDRLVVASKGLQNSQSGAVTLFVRDGAAWTEEAELDPGPLPAGQRFGASVAISGSRVAVGIAAQTQGAVAIFQRDGNSWPEHQRIPRPDLTVHGVGLDDSFGTGVDMDGDLLAVDGRSHFVYRRSPEGHWEPLAPFPGSVIAGTSSGPLRPSRLDGMTLISGQTSLPGGVGLDRLDSGFLQSHQLGEAAHVPAGTIDSGDGGYGNRFGNRLASDGQRLLVGSRFDFNPANAAYGKVHVFNKGKASWELEGELTVPVSDAAFRGGNFGASLAIHGNTALVGHTNTNGGHGAVHVFERIHGAWTHVATFTRQSGLSAFDDDQRFGEAVALHGDAFVVSDPGAEPVAFRNDGMVFVYRKRDGAWSLESRLIPPSSPVVTNLGVSLAIQEGRVIAGSRGAVHIFEHSESNWSQARRLESSMGSGSPYFGSLVQASGDSLVVSSYVEFSSSGLAIEFFRRSGDQWSFESRHTADDFGVPSPDPLFGSSIALSGDLCLVGAPGQLLAGESEQGAVYLLTRTAGTWQPDLEPFARGVSGPAVAIGAGDAFIGRPGQAVTATWSEPIGGAGQVAVSRLPGPCAVLQVKSNGRTLKSGAPATLPVTLAGDESALEFVIQNSGPPVLADFRAELEGADAGDFVVLLPPVHELAAGQSDTFRIVFSPESIGKKSAVLRLHSNACAGPFLIPLTGTAISYPEIEVSRHEGGPLADGLGVTDFGATGGGEVSAVTFNIRNAGLAPLLKLSLKVTGPAAKDFRVPNLPKSLAAGESLDFTVEFRPAKAGTRMATLQILSSDADETPFDIPLTGTGIARPEIEVMLGKSPLATGVSILDFGTAAAGKTVVRKILVRNSGWLPLDDLTVGIVGDATFTSTTALPSSLAPGKSAALSIVYRSSGPAATSATLRISSNDADEDPFDIQLRAGSPAAPISPRAAGPKGGDSSPADDAALIAFAFGLDSTSPGPGGSIGSLPVIRPIERNGRRWICFEFVRRRDGLLDYEPQLSPDLVSFSLAEGRESVTVVDEHWDMVVLEVEMPEAAARQGFGRIKVTRR